MKQCTNNEENWTKQVADANRLEMDFFGRYHSGPGEYKPCVVEYATTIATATEALIDTFGLEKPKQFSRYFFEATVMAGAFAGIGYFMKAMLQFLICGGWIYWENLRDAWGDLFSVTYDWPEGGVLLRMAAG